MIIFLVKANIVLNVNYVILPKFDEFDYKSGVRTVLKNYNALRA